MVAGTTSTTFINEFHYDNVSADTGEFIEVVTPAGTSLGGWTLLLYNGNGGIIYNTIDLGSITPTTVDGRDFYNVPTPGIQNGAPDGFALVDNNGSVVQFLSYEGTFTASTGPAAGLISTDVGVSQSGFIEAVGTSLQLTGTGSTAGDFTWNATSIAATAGAANTGQSFGGAPQPGTLSIVDASVIEGNSGTTDLVFTVNRSGGSAGAVTASYALTNTTTSNDDFTGPTSGTVTFADGQTSATITIGVVGDTNIEIDETFDLTLSNPTGGATITDNTGTGTIQNDDVPPPGPAEVFINEIHYDTAGSDVGEGIEIAGPAGTDLTGWSLALYNGNGGVVYSTIALSGVIPDQDDGFGTLAFLTPAIQNGAPDGVALVGPAGQVVQFLSYEGPLTATNGPAAGLTAIDIGVSENNAPLGTSLQAGGNGFIANDFTFQPSQNATFGQVNTGQNFVAANPAGTLYVSDASRAEGDDGTTNFTFNVFRVGGSAGAVAAQWGVGFDGDFTDANLADFGTGPGATFGTVNFANGETFKTITVRVAGDTTGEPTEFFDLVLFNPQGGVSIGDGLGLGTIVNDDPLVLQIGEIQGAAHTSPFVGNEVTTSGIVTAVAANGFYLQDPDGDGNSATSDALFVFTGTAPTVVAGDAISILGTVNEFRPGGDAANLTTTQLINPVITVISSGNALPEAVLIGPDGIRPPTESIDSDNFATFNPNNDGIDFFESLEGMLVTVQNPVAVDATNSFGELYTVASDGAGNLAASNVSEDGLVVVRGGEDALGAFNSGAGSDFNPERIQIDEAGTINGQTFAVPVVTPGTVLNNVTGVIDYAFGNFQLRPTEAVTVAQASTNVAEQTTLVSGAVNQLSLATYNVLNLDINAADGDDDVGNGRLAGIATDIGINLGSPDIVVLQEVQDDSGAINDGTISAQLTLEALAQSIFDQTGVRYSVFDNPFAVNGETGGQPGGNIRVAFLYRGDRVDFDESSAFTITNPDDGELVAAFQGSRAPLGGNFTFNGQTVTVIGNHFSSKIGSNTTFSAVQPPLNAAELSRAAQAAAVNDYVDGLLAANPNALIAVAGDFNEFQFEEPLRVLTGELDFDGARVSGGGEEVLQNLSFLLPEEERFSALFEGNAQQLDHIFATATLARGAQIDAVRTNTILGNVNADHDPILALFNVGTQVISGSRGNDVLNGGGGNDRINGGDGNDTIGGGGGDDTITGGNGHDTIDGGSGDDTIFGGNGDDTINGGNGEDTIDGGQGNNTINGGADDDTITGGIGANIINGDGGNDTIRGGRGAERLNGGDGNDTISGGAGNDVIDGGNDDDTIDGGIGADRINGGAGNDTIIGGAGNDTISGGDGDDIIDGGANIDRIDGGRGADVLTGGTFSDFFVLHADHTAADADIVTDFNTTQDRIRLEGANGKAITFVQDGADTRIEADGMLVATILNVAAAQVQLRTNIIAPAPVTMTLALDESAFRFAETGPAASTAPAGGSSVLFNPLGTNDNDNDGGMGGLPDALPFDPNAGLANDPWLQHGQFGIDQLG